MNAFNSLKNNGVHKKPARILASVELSAGLKWLIELGLII